MRRSAICTLALSLAVSAVPAAARPKAAKPAAAVKQLQADLKKITLERDELRDRLAATEGFQQEVAAAKKGRDLAREEAALCRKELEQIKASLSENQNSSDAILKDLGKAKADQAAAQDQIADLRRQLEEANAKLQGKADAGALVILAADITPAKPMNLARITPKAKKVDRGVVVVNVLISERGDVLEVRLLQGLPGEGEWVQKANEACVEAAKRLVFDPARAADGKTPVRVWQGVGFLID